MKKALLALLALLALSSLRAQTPTVLSVANLLPNYGLDSAWVSDSAAAIAYLDAQPQDYPQLTNLCVQLQNKAQRVIHSIESDCDFRDSLFWIDSSTVISDYSIYEYRLRSFADLMQRRSLLYARLEQQRIQAEKEAARLRAIEEANRQQQERNLQAAQLRDAIQLHHRTIESATSGIGISDKNKTKQLRDIYYSYLMVRNKYDLNFSDATPQTIAQLDQLNAFQLDLLENILGQNSLLYQIDNFKNVLKLRCQKDNADVYRSYSKVFKHTNVPVSFADVTEYEDYTSRLRTIIAVQQRYLLTLDLRATIASGTDNIVSTFGKKYRDIVSSYRDVLRLVDLLPTFTTHAQSVIFIQNLDAFIAAQQLYLDIYPRLEDISRRSDTIVSYRQFPDLVASYRDLLPHLRPLPSFKDPDGAALYFQQLDDVCSLQQCYLQAIEMRTLIATLDDSLTAARRTDRTLTLGYRLLSRQSDLKPNFSSIPLGQAFLRSLDSHVEMQQLCLNTLHKIELIQANEKRIASKDHPFSHIRRAYNRLYKAYRALDEISNTEDLRRYNRQADLIIDMQQAFLDAIVSPSASDIDAKLRHESSIENIKLLINLK